MAASEEYKDYLIDLFAPLGPVEIRRMFGGLGGFYRGVMFAICFDGVVYFKVDGENRADFEARDMGPFRYDTKKGSRALKSYFRTPDDILESEDDCLVWARRAVEAALRADEAKAARRRE